MQAVVVMGYGWNSFAWLVPALLQHLLQSLKDLPLLVSLAQLGFAENTVCLYRSVCSAACLHLNSLDQRLPSCVAFYELSVWVLSIACLVTLVRYMQLLDYGNMLCRESIYIVDLYFGVACHCGNPYPLEDSYTRICWLHHLGADSSYASPMRVHIWWY